MLTAIIFIFCMAVGYLSGSISSAVIVSQLFNLPDPRKNGSKNPGATNILRLSGKRFAATVLLFDFLKGFFPVVFAHLIGASTAIASFTALAAVLGHVYPMFFDLKGGKGVATALGSLMGLHFLLGVSLIALWLIIANFSRFSSLASIFTILLAPFLAMMMLHSPDPFIPLIIMTLIIIYRHRDNISRLMDGTEPKIILKNQFTDLDDAITDPKPVETITDITTEEVEVAPKKSKKTTAKKSAT